MGKKQTQFRFEEKLISDINKVALNEGITVSEVVRNALKLYILIYDRTREKNARLILESIDAKSDKCELVLPWSV